MGFWGDLPVLRADSVLLERVPFTEALAKSHHSISVLLAEGKYNIGCGKTEG